MSLVKNFTARCANNATIPSTSVKASLKQAYIIDCINESLSPCSIKELTHLTADVDLANPNVPNTKKGLYFLDMANDIIVVSDGITTSSFSTSRNKSIDKSKLIISRACRSNYMDENGEFIGRNGRNYVHLHLDEFNQQFINTKDKTVQCLSYTLALYMWNDAARQLVEKALLDPTGCPWLLVVNHKNNDCRDNNVFFNLELCTQSQNLLHSSIVEMIWTRDDLKHLRGAGYTIKDNNKSVYKHDINFYLSINDAVKVGNTTLVMLNELKRKSDEEHPVSQYDKNLKALTSKLVNAYKLSTRDAMQAARVLLANITANADKYVPNDFSAGDAEDARGYVLDNIVDFAFDEFSKGLEKEMLAYTE